MSKIKVQILMSTYNGEKYIKKQLDSIMKQDIPVSLYIRDDGSSDKTVDIIKEYEACYDNISHTEGNNIGVVKSFLNSLRKRQTMRIILHLPTRMTYGLQIKYGAQ